MSDLIKALRNQKQYDEYGDEVLVSRQACDEAADALEAQAKDVERLKETVDEIQAARHVNRDH